MNDPTPAKRILRRILNAVLPKDSMTVRVLSGPARGLKLVIEPQRERSYWAGTHERAVQAVLLDLVRPGMTVWDIGAHAGFFTAVCSRRLGATGMVHSFEPGAETRRRLEETVRLNGLRNVRVHACAVGAERHEGVLHGVGRSAQATLRPIGARASTSHAVEVRALSDLWEELGPPDVIKVDAEGAEVGIVEGGATLLEAGRTDLVVEVHDDHAADRIRDLLPGHRCDRVDAGHWVFRAGGGSRPNA